MPEHHTPLPGAPGPDRVVAALRDLGDQLALPTADPVAVALDRIGTPEPGFRGARWLPQRPSSGPKRVVAAAAAVLAVALAVTLAIPDSRQAVARWLGMGHVNITYSGEVPAQVYGGRPAGAVTLTWASSPELPEVGGSGIGLLLAALPGTTDAGGVSKQIGPGTTVELVRVGDSPAYWIAGEPHALLVVNPAGEIVPDATRLAGNT